MTSTAIVAYLTLFASVGFLFLFFALLLGHFLRPNKPTDEKVAIYECGEPSVGSSRVRFDLRFYVVALVFLILDVEVAFFFPWATVFGKSTELMSPGNSGVQLASKAENIYRHFGVANPTLPDSKVEADENTVLIRAQGKQLSRAAMADMLVFFGVLLVGFAYVWWRGDLSWVKTVKAQHT
ncbi:MAG: NADH-quinone oxidoreductase subunit A [Pirellulales bacterium]|nr:NADH-quinone oxidoreductase subunit A [Pirellulales bacterium]